MCGIVGHVSGGASLRSQEVVMGGLARLEYRGYDSAGIAALGNELQVRKAVGKLQNLRALLKAEPLAPMSAAIGHTRWATHGTPTTTNAHPHTAGHLALVHNGIIENADALRVKLHSEGATFVSETDTEVAAHLINSLYEADGENDTLVAAGGADTQSPAAARLARALLTAMRQLEGTFTLLVIHEDAPGVIVAARRSSPLVLGIGEGENFLGSDVLAFAEHTDKAVEIGQDELAIVTAENIIVTDKDGQVAQPKYYQINFQTEAADKAGWPTFMEKEIAEQPRAIADTLADRFDATGHLALDELRIPAELLRTIDKIVVVGCGTAAYAGQVARYAIEHWCRIPVEVELAHEFRYRDPVVTEKTLVVAISQSGETMDTIMAIRHAREQGARVLAIVNTPGSTISRESDAVLLTHAGREIAVASTKAFTAQLAACYLLGLYLAQVRGNKYIDEIEDYMQKLGEIPAKVQSVLAGAESVRQVARTLAEESSVYFLGRHVGFPVAMEGALKLKEIAYIHAEGFAAGELKHGPIALIDEGVVVVFVVPTPRRPELHAKVLSNIAEVKARGARVFCVAEEGDQAAAELAEAVFAVPPAPTLYLPLLTVVPLQILACEVAKTRGLDVDQPRNLAKSVTVE
ncbi:MAG: glutamine--fructose-6-phosphate transaminase (isomerizing) [Actinomycetaceae bacterium]|nr:glutamine--fructose-6-phosphate transaminase (isomerizing) [Actinomycetaceae bacterium]